MSTPSHHGVDYIVGSAAASSPVWLEWLHATSDVAAALAAIGGCILVGMRILLTVRDFQKRRAYAEDRSDSE